MGSMVRISSAPMATPTKAPTRGTRLVTPMTTLMTSAWGKRKMVMPMKQSTPSMQLSVSWPEMKFAKVSLARDGEALKPCGEAAREEGVYAAAHEAAYPLLLREDVDGDDGREHDVYDAAHDGRADVRGGADDVARRCGRRSRRAVAYVAEDLHPVDVAEIGREREVQGLEHPVRPGDEVVHIAGHLRDDGADRLDQARAV